MQDRIELDLGEIFKIIYKRKFVIVGVTIVVAIITTLINIFVLKPIYEAKVSIIVGQQDVMENIAYSYSSDTIVLSQKLIKTYSKIATSDTVLKKTIKDLGLNYNSDEYEMFKKRVIVTSEENTQLLEIGFQDKDPVKASTIVNKLTDNFLSEAEEYLPMGDLKLLDKSEIPKKAIKPNKKLNVIVATAITFIGVATIVILKNLRELKIVDEQDVEKYLDLKVIGTIRQMNSN